MSLVNHIKNKKYPRTYSGQQLMKILNISKPTVKFRAEKLGIKKNGLQWNFSESDIERMRAYKYIRSPHFYFSEQGDYLIIESKLNSSKMNLD